MKKLFLFLSLCVPCLALSTEIACNNGALSISDSDDYQIKKFQTIVVHDDGVANYFRDEFRKMTQNSLFDKDCTGELCSYSYDEQHMNATFWVVPEQNGYTGINGQQARFTAVREGEGLRITLAHGQNGKSVNWFFEKCGIVPK